MRKAFTLIELLVIIVIIGTMVTVSVLSVRSGQGVARVRGATRDILAQIRRARSMALVTRTPCHIVYSTKTVDDEICASVEVELGASNNMFKERPQTVQTLSGEIINIGGDSKSTMTDEELTVDSESMESPLERLMSKGVESEVVKGMRLKVTKDDEVLEVGDSEEKRKSSVSAAYWVDGQKKTRELTESTSESDASDTSVEARAPVSIRWEANGRTEPHRVWIYPDGATPKAGLSIKIDRFGAIKVLADGEDD